MIIKQLIHQTIILMFIYLHNNLKVDAYQLTILLRTIDINIFLQSSLVNDDERLIIQI